MLNRRNLIASALALPVATASRSLTANPIRARRVIDVHHHFIPPEYATAKRDLLLGMFGGNASALSWSPERSLEQMNQAEITKAILSLIIPGVWFGDSGEARRLARESNEFAAQTVSKYPDRFGFFAAIPLPDAEGSLSEIKYALETLRADGILLMTNYDAKYLGDQQFARVLQELNERRVVVYLHPRPPPCCTGLVPEIPDTLLELIFDTTRTVASLLFTGTLFRMRGIQWILSHGGGALPMIEPRISNFAASRKDLAHHFPEGVMSELSRLYYDTANVARSGAFAGLRAMAPSSQILFGTDGPGLSGPTQLEQLRSAALSEKDLEAIEHGNADRLIQR